MSDEPTIDLKKRARRRLVGAAALALLAVIVLPIVMDSEPKPSGQEIQIHIPNRDSDTLVSHVMPGTSTVIPATNTAEPAESVTPPPSEASTKASEVVATKPALPGVKPIVPALVAPVASKPETAPAQTAPAIKTDVAHAEAALDGKDSAPWIVQLGAYQNPANVKQLHGKLKAMGIVSYTEKFDSPQGQRTRVRAGPFKSQEDADRARLRIKKIGVDGTVAQKQ